MMNLNIQDIDFETHFSTLIEKRSQQDQSIIQRVKEIIQQVKEQGDEALYALTKQLDGFDMKAETLKISDEEINNAIDKCDKIVLSALEVAHKRIERYHKYQIPEDKQFTDEEGVMLGYKWNAVASAGIYVPGGTASYPSSVLMNAIPAKVAGVKRVVMTVPCPKGDINPHVLAAAKLSGVDEIYRIGGAQAIAALAYGTEMIQSVDMIVGPGNAYVAAAKREVFGQVGIDMVAGPSEILILADAKNNPSWIAADLLAQAEHDVLAQSVLIFDDESFGEAVLAEIKIQLKQLQRSKIAQASWDDFGVMIKVDDVYADKTIELVNKFSTEHLELAIDNAQEFSKEIYNAGAIFIGRFTPEVIGDYIAGPSHVLPTGRTARFSSGLSVLNFMKRSSLISCDAQSLAQIGKQAMILAECEGLDAHARSVALRLQKFEDNQ